MLLLRAENLELCFLGFSSVKSCANKVSTSILSYSPHKTLSMKHRYTIFCFSMHGAAVLAYNICPCEEIARISTACMNATADFISHLNRKSGSMVEQLLLRLSEYASSLKSRVAEATADLNKQKEHMDNLLHSLIPK